LTARIIRGIYPYWTLLRLIADYWSLIMPELGRVVTTKLPDDLVRQVDEIAVRIDRSKSWIMRQALSEWLAEEQRRHDLTMEALEAVDDGQVLSHDEVLAMIEARKRQLRGKHRKSAE
jgi:predicted transcriptional regulator